MTSLKEHKKRQIPRQCEVCGIWGHIGKSLIEHKTPQGTKKVLCHRCHLEEHRIKKEE